MDMPSETSVLFLVEGPGAHNDTHASLHITVPSLFDPPSLPLSLPLSLSLPPLPFSATLP
jgi:hypothetical protein